MISRVSRTAKGCSRFYKNILQNWEFHVLEATRYVSDLFEMKEDVNYQKINNKKLKSLSDCKSSQTIPTHVTKWTTYSFLKLVIEIVKRHQDVD